MPQVDLETLFCGGEGKVACETMASADESVAPAEDPYMPAESFQVRIGEEIDWTDINAVYERDDSTKGNTNPKSHHANQPHPSSSQRFSGNLKAKAPIIGLPNKIQHSGYLGRSGRRPPNGRIFPKKRRAGGRKSAVPLAEPGSPKVSCFGKVLSDREKERKHHRRGPSPAREVTAATEEEQGMSRSTSGGFWPKISAFLCCVRPDTRELKEEGEEEEESTASEKAVPWSGRPSAVDLVEEETAAVPPAGLGMMRRFSSGRRPPSWGGDSDADADGPPLEKEGLGR
ncbi:hypothetical protein AXF42_Ash014744 [Apostasia shenzhenica]|uniref:Uncharacterized protein n=1 Tax=Apostasia shenzhenica TaxID=1088818 RepID=A0A2H9ZW55_9ASPA|nr:hypothetical protein AXF42_Ash014744 [Apostasia shenzhenica]